MRSLSELFQSYGGWRALANSAYLRIALGLSLLAWPYVVTEKWVSSAVTILPALIGFSVAAYAIFFVILNEEDRRKLSRPMPSDPVRSPLSMLLSTISFAVLIQLTALIYAIIFDGKPFPTLQAFSGLYKYTNMFFSAIGILLLMYGLTLVAATVLTLFRLVGIKSKVSSATPPNP
jgi:hypothetical protein